MKRAANPTLMRRAGVLLLAALLALSANQALAEEGGDDPLVRARAAQILPGATVPVMGRGFEAGQKLVLFTSDERLNAEPFVVGEQGGFEGRVTVPAAAEVGLLPVSVRADGNQIFAFKLKISKQLPLSGADDYELVRNQLAAGLYQVAYSASHDALFVSRSVGFPPVRESAIVRINPETLAVMDHTTPPAAPADKKGQGDQPDKQGLYAIYGLGVDRANQTLWATNTLQNTVAVYRQGDLSLARQFRPGLVPHARSVVVDTGQGKAYVSSVSGGFVAVFDTKRLQHLKNIAISIPADGQSFVPMGLALDAASGTVYVSSMAAPAIAVIDTASDKVERVFAVDGARGLRDLDWNAKQKRLLAVSYGNDHLLVVNPKTGDTEQRVYVGASPLSVAWDPTSGMAFVAVRGAGTVAVVEPETGTLVANLAVGSFPNQVIVDPAGHVFAVNKAQGEDDPKGNRITRISTEDSEARADN